MKTQNLYELPLGETEITRIVRDNESHQRSYAGSIDFAVPLSTPVLAAATGTVARVRDDSDKFGKEPRFGQDVNYITIEHPNNELSEYLHLAKDSALVKAGQKVKAGQQIATTGLSSWMYAPHLHFMVYKNGAEFQCLDIQFIFYKILVKT